MNVFLFKKKNRDKIISERGEETKYQYITHYEIKVSFSNGYNNRRTKSWGSNYSKE
jgi:hypothetical protein